MTLPGGPQVPRRTDLPVPAVGHFQSHDRSVNRRVSDRFESTAAIGRRPFELDRSSKRSPTARQRRSTPDKCHCCMARRRCRGQVTERPRPIVRSRTAGESDLARRPVAAFEPGLDRCQALAKQLHLRQDFSLLGLDLRFFLSQHRCRARGATNAIGWYKDKTLKPRGASLRLNQYRFASPARIDRRQAPPTPAHGGATRPRNRPA